MVNDITSSSVALSDKLCPVDEITQNAYDRCLNDLDSVKGLRVGHLNVRSLIDKIDEIRFLLFKLDFDVLCFSETWFNESISNEQLCIDEYSIFRKDRMDGKRGGGVCIFVKKINFF